MKTIAFLVAALFLGAFFVPAARTSYIFSLFIIVIDGGVAPI